MELSFTGSFGRRERAVFLIPIPCFFGFRLPGNAKFYGRMYTDGKRCCCYDKEKLRHF